MTSPFYLRRDFSIPLTGLKSRGLMSLDAEPGPDSLFYKLWNSCADIAKRVLGTDYFQGIKNSNLDPNAYGILMVLDAYYCMKAEGSYMAAVAKAEDETLKNFLQGKLESYQRYNVTYHDLWHIREPNSVSPSNGIKEYAEYEAYVAGSLESWYLFVVMLPCEYLWNWVANQLDPEVPTDGLYRFWIDGNGGTPTGAYQMADMLEDYRNRVDEDKAMEIFKTAMNHELRIFTEATQTNNLWQRKATF